MGKKWKKRTTWLFKGYGLKVSKQYDNGDDTWLGFTNQVGEWYIAYHGTSGQYAKNILEAGVKKGSNQVHRNFKNINPLTKDKFPNVGVGVKKVLVVTSDYHVPRSLALAKDLGYDACGMGSPCKPEYWIKNHAREALAWVKYWGRKYLRLPLE